jgi:excisionase family DNA binding protein
MSIVNEEELRQLIQDVVRAVLRDELKAVAQSMPADSFLPVSEAARVAGVAPGTIRAWIGEGRLRRYHAGRVLRVMRRELEEYLTDPSLETDANVTPEMRAMSIFNNRHKRRSLPE